jgi:tetratricopeptide (TPR) repeat protein
VKRLKLLPLVFAGLALLMASTFAHAQKDYQKVLDSGLTNDEAYSMSLVQEAKDSPNRQELLEEALQFSPDLPALYFKLAWSSLPNVFASLQYLVGGIKAYARSFWWAFSFIGLVFTSALLSLAVTAAILVLVRLPIQIPLLSHDINESKAKLLIPLTLFAAALGGPLFFIGGALVVVGIHLKKHNRLPVYLVLAVLMVSPLLVKAANRMLATAASPELRAIVAVNEGRDNNLALEVLRDESSPEARFSYAMALKRKGRYAEAEAIYKDLNSQKPSWMVLNNLANIYQARNQTDEAKETLKKAADMSSSAVVLYNLSQVYRGTLDYATGDKYYREASDKDRDEVSKYTAIASVNPNRFVIDVTYTDIDFWKEAIGSSGDYFWPYPIGTMPAVGLAVFLLILSIAFGATIHSQAFRCSRCAKIVCNICSRDSRWGQMCPECYNSLVKVKDMDRQKRVSALLRAYEHKDKIKRMVRILSFLPPGIAQISVGRALGGFAFLWAFCFCGVLIWLNPLIGTGLAGFSHSWLNVPAVLAMVAIYAASTVYVNGRLESEWL